MEERALKSAAEPRVLSKQTEGIWTIATWSDGSKAFSVPENRVIRRPKIAGRSPMGAGSRGQ